MGSKEVPLEGSVPVINVSELLASISSNELDFTSTAVVKTAKEIRNACLQWGFFYLVGHGVDPKLIEELRKVSSEFFHRPLEFKKSIERNASHYRGYSDFELTKQKKDWKEAFDFGAEKSNPDKRMSKFDAGRNQWPEGMGHFKDVLTQYFSTMHSLSTLLMDLIFISLEVDPLSMRHHFSEEEDTSVCRINYYPPCPNSTSVLGVGPHSDSGVLTMLLQDETVSSLQVEKDGRFHFVRPIPYSFVINIGDMMQVWSNGIYKAPVHRVLVNSTKERFSVPFFLTPKYESDVVPLETCVSAERPVRYRPVNWGNFRHERILGNLADYGEEIQIKQFEQN